MSEKCSADGNHLFVVSLMAAHKGMPALSVLMMPRSPAHCQSGACAVRSASA